MQRQLLSALALVVVVLACAGEANALVQRTFVSGLGSDANPCSRTEPCRTFAAAIAQTQAGGEVLALDTAGYGPVTIDKAISLISPPGVYAGITTTVPNTNAITIEVGATEVVVLKGLSLTGLGVGNSGVAFVAGKELHAESLTISGFLDAGIAFAPVAASRLSVLDSVIRNNGNAGIAALGPDVVFVAIDRARLTGNVYGLVAGSLSRVTLRDSVAAGNSGVGVWASHSTAVVNIENSLATGNYEGFTSWGLMRVAGSTVTENVIGVSTFLAGSVVSRGNNTVEGNTGGQTFTSLFAPK